MVRETGEKGGKGVRDISEVRVVVRERGRMEGRELERERGWKGVRDISERGGKGVKGVGEIHVSEVKELLISEYLQIILMSVTTTCTYVHVYSTIIACLRS